MHSCKMLGKGIIKAALLLLLHLSLRVHGFAFQTKHHIASLTSASQHSLEKCYLFGSTCTKKQRVSITMASNSALTSISAGKKGFFARFKRFLSFPMRFLISRPWKIISQILSRSKDIDGATAIIEKEIIVNDSTVSTSVIDELNDVSMVTSVAKETSSPLQIVSGDIFTDAAIASNSPTVATKGATRTQPVGERWAIAGNGVDLSGKYRVIVTEEFKKAYDEYLASLGQPLIVRTVALGIIGRTTEELSMTEKGKYLLIRGTNARGIWDRTLVASGTEIGVDDFDPLLVPVMVSI